MKYAKELDNVIHNVPLHERIFIISYRRWKKLKNPGRWWRTLLIIDILMTPKKLLDINIKTMYKICKRLEKRFGLEANEFYNRVSKIFYPDASITLRDSLKT